MACLPGLTTSTCACHRLTMACSVLPPTSTYFHIYFVVQTTSTYVRASRWDQGGRWAGLRRLLGWAIFISVPCWWEQGTKWDQVRAGSGPGETCGVGCPGLKTPKVIPGIYFGLYLGVPKRLQNPFNNINSSWCSPVLGTNHSNSKWFAPKTGLQLLPYKGCDHLKMPASTSS